MEVFIVWYLQQSWFVIVGLPLSSIVTLVGVWKTVSPGQLVCAIEDDLHNGQTEPLVFGPRYVSTPDQEKVSELAAEVFNNQNEFDNEFEVGQSYQNRAKSPRYSRVVHPRYPTQPLPVQSQYKVRSTQPQPQYVTVRRPF